LLKLDSDEQPGSPINRLFTLKIDRETLLQMISLFSKEIMEAVMVLSSSILFVAGNLQTLSTMASCSNDSLLMIAIASRFCEAIRR
jgi:hypothetical protein